jgi:hypothetical protein
MAHSSYETEIEFRPISQAFSEIKFFLLHFDEHMRDLLREQL